jgi:hypothetical protein
MPGGASGETDWADFGMVGFLLLVVRGVLVKVLGSEPIHRLVVGMTRPRLGALLLIAVLIVAACKPAPSAMPVSTPSALVDTAQPRALLAPRVVPLPFEENRGQADPSYAFLLRAGSFQVGLAAGGIAYRLVDYRPGADRNHRARSADRPGEPTRVVGVEQRYVGGRPTTPVSAAPAAALISYLKGPREEWLSGVATARQVAYRDAWDGVDVLVERAADGMKSTYLVAPYADPAAIRLAWFGGEARLSVDGDLEIDTPLGMLREHAPVAWQDRGSERTPVAATWAEAHGTEGPTWGFALGAYDPALPLVIDPVLEYAGYLGGADYETAGTLVLDADGAMYIAGDTASTEATFPDGDGFGAVPGFDRTYNGSSHADEGDGFVVKLAPDGLSLIYATYIGGASDDIIFAITLDSARAAYVAGQTRSSGASFPATAGPDLTYNDSGTKFFNCDGFVAKLAPDGQSLAYAGYIGGSGIDFAFSIRVDAAGAAYVGGTTQSPQTSFPDGDGFGAVPGFDQTVNGFGSLDAFVVKVAPSGQGLLYATYIGGSSTDEGYGLAVDATGAAYLAGVTESTEATFPDGDGFGAVPGFDRTHNGDEDGFLAKLTPNGLSLVYATYIGGGGQDAAWNVALAPSGAATVVGSTASTQATFPDGDGFGAVPGFDQTYNGGTSDGFVVRVDPDGLSLQFATYLGGSGEESALGVALDATGRIYMVGRTASIQATFPDGDGFGGVPGLDQTYNGGSYDGFVARINPATHTPTSTATSTVTPTSTMTPTAPPAPCSPRPNVGVATAKLGTGQMQATLAALTSSNTPTNSLSSVRIISIDNAVVRLNGGIVAVGQTVPLANGTQQATLLLDRRAPAGNPILASTVQFAVTDRCGEWKSFIGGGPAAF